MKIRLQKLGIFMGLLTLIGVGSLNVAYSEIPGWQAITVVDATDYLCSGLSKDNRLKAGACQLQPQNAFPITVRTDTTDSAHQKTPITPPTLIGVEAKTIVGVAYCSPSFPRGTYFSANGCDAAGVCFSTTFPIFFDEGSTLYVVRTIREQGVVLAGTFDKPSE